MIKQRVNPKIVFRALSAVLLLAASSVAAQCQADWPRRPVTLTVAYPAGSATDAVARTVATPLSQKLGQPIVIENRAGADGMIAGRALARTEANGYTFGL